jgi:hypothetical protein
MTGFPVFEVVQRRADGTNRHPAVEAVSGLARMHKTAVSGYGAPQKAPQGHAALQAGLFAGEVTPGVALTRRRVLRPGVARLGGSLRQGSDRRS